MGILLWPQAPGEHQLLQVLQVVKELVDLLCQSPWQGVIPAKVLSVALPGLPQQHLGSQKDRSQESNGVKEGLHLQVCSTGSM